jgi:hypothetical protein
LKITAWPIKKAAAAFASFPRLEKVINCTSQENANLRNLGGKKAKFEGLNIEEFAA